ncbi:MAG: hypothetical protein P3W90_002065 [Paracoccus sp. (in: a-proteobacteria)]|nr:hypothetical protein [Paracoccus sp. (in: a-proteobacteria)]
MAKAVYFQPGASAASVSGQVRGYDTRTHEISVAAGQRLTVDLKSQNSSLYFNIYAPGNLPGTGSVLFDASRGDMPYRATLSRSGTYTVEVYLMRNAARRAEWATYRLAIVRTPPSAAPVARHVSHQRPRFRPGAQVGAQIARPLRAAPVSVTRPVPRPYLRQSFTSQRLYPGPIVETPVLGFSSMPPPPRPRSFVTMTRPYAVAAENLALPCKPGPGKITQKCAFNLSQRAGSAVVRVVMPDGRLRAFRLSEEGNASTVGDVAQPLQVVKEDGLVTVIPAPGERIEIPQAILRRP